MGLFSETQSQDVFVTSKEWKAEDHVTLHT